MTARIQPPLQCVHCHTTETPLWRAGPLGPKTLCNACGVRWKKTGSVIPRAKRPSSSPPNNKNSLNVRKRPRVNSDNLNHAITSPSSNPSLGTALNSNNNNISSNSNSNSNSNNNSNNSNSNNNNNINNSNSNSNKNSNIDPPSNNNNNNNKSDRLPNHHQHQSVDSAARVAAASMPAPRPISVFRVSDVQRSKYESVFSGLMVVPRPRDGSLTSSNLNNILQNHYQQNNNNNNNNSNNIKSSDGDFIESRAIRTRTQTPKASAYFSDLSASLGHANQNHKDSSNRDDAIPPSPSPPPIDLSLTNSVYVTEVHAPSPSPSPPPMPRKRVAEGGGFRLVLSTVADERNE